jgi:hypothetical protein
MFYMIAYDYMRILFLFVFLYTVLLYVLHKNGKQEYVRDAATVAALITLSIRLFIQTYCGGVDV